MMKRKFTDDELMQLIQESNDRALEGRLERLRILVDNDDPNPAPYNALALEYHEEARLCWYMGAFVAAIVMSQLAFEEMLRSQYRMSEGVGGNLNEHKKVDKAGFKDLIEQSKKDGWLSPKEAASLHKIRKEFRNPYVHPQDVQINETGRSKRSDFDIQHLKITAPELLGSGTKDEARETIILLLTLFPKISRRLWGM